MSNESKILLYKNKIKIYNESHRSPNHKFCFWPSFSTAAKGARE